MINLGCHLSSADGFEKMGKTALDISANTFQFFLRNPRGGSAKVINPEDANKLEKILVENRFAPILAHSPYTLNMASSKPEVRQFAKGIFKDDLKRMELIPCNLYNFHPGSHSGIGLEQGIDYIVEILNDVMTPESNTIVLLETMSGKGTEIGKTFEELKAIIDRVSLNDKIGICLDTCHLFCAGYDIVNDLEGVLEKLDKAVGIQKIKAIHLNDSMAPFNSCKDRHAEIGKGEIGLEGLINFITYPQLKDIPFILETPCTTEEHKEEIRKIRKMIG